MRRTNKTTSGTSFMDVTFSATPNQLIGILGETFGSGDGKTTHDWELETEDGEVFTIYDWKEKNLTPDKIINWHIGGYTLSACEKGLTEIKNQLL